MRKGGEPIRVDIQLRQLREFFNGRRDCRYVGLGEVEARLVLIFASSKLSGEIEGCGDSPLLAVLRARLLLLSAVQDAHHLCTVVARGGHGALRAEDE